MNKKIIEFLKQSNYIEGEYSEQALEDAKDAWEYAYEYRGKNDTSYLLEIHRRLLKNLKPEIAGKLRNCNVFIGGEMKSFINETIIKDSLFSDVFVRMFVNIDTTKSNKEEYCKKTHIAFEKIHPFVDGNGRVGRILYNIHRLRLELPIHIIKEKDKYEYYEWFRN